jgi:hypothetical protein
MGLEFKIVPSERRELARVTCDKCRQEIEKVHEGGWNEMGEPYSIYHEPSFKDFFLLEKSWGYFSGKDTETHRLVLCEACYDEVFANVTIQITNYM